MRLIVIKLLLYLLNKLSHDFEEVCLHQREIQSEVKYREREDKIKLYYLQKGKSQDVVIRDLSSVIRRLSTCILRENQDPKDYLSRRMYKRFEHLLK